MAGGHREAVLRVDHEEMRKAYLRALAGTGPVVERREQPVVTHDAALRMLETMAGSDPAGKEERC